jgi:predicted SPOUT superfamily RNA methylase MTH1
MNSSKRKRNDADGGGGGGGGGGRGGGRSGRVGRGRGRANPNDPPSRQHHRFGRVMSHPPRLGPPDPSRGGRRPTVSIAVPGSVVSNAQTRELQTQLAGQIARAAAVFRVDEVVVYDDGLGSGMNPTSNYRRGPAAGAAARRPPPPPAPPGGGGGGDGDEEEAKDGGGEGEDGAGGPPPRRDRPRPSSDPHAFLARVLQYVECPQYLRRRLFPMHPDLQFAGLLPPLDAPHHLRRGDVSRYREGVVVEAAGAAAAAAAAGGGGGSLVDCGVPNRLVR